VGGTAEVVRDGETGLLCRPEDPSGLADRIVTLLAIAGYARACRRPRASAIAACSASTAWSIN
jgi:glycosyltransferase involved in cell wall biosynthesis